MKGLTEPVGSATGGVPVAFLLLLVVPLVVHPDRVDRGDGRLEDDHARQEGKVHVQVPVELLHPRLVVGNAVEQQSPVSGMVSFFLF